MLKTQYDYWGATKQSAIALCNQQVALCDAQRAQLKEQAKTLGCSWALMEA